MGRYVPRTYYNRRFLRIIVRTIFTVFVALIALFIILFFALQNYRQNNEDGTVRIEIPWLTEETSP